MTDREGRPEINFDAWMEIAAPILGLAIPDGARHAVVVNLRITLGHAQLFDDFLLDDREEPAPVFEA